MKMSFEVAAKQQIEEEENEIKGEPWFEFSLLGQDFVVPEKPSTARAAALLAGLADGDAVFFRSTISFLENIIEDGRGRMIRKMLERDEIPFEIIWGGDELNPKGIVDTIIELASANPTDGRGDSSNSQPATGKRSTGRSPGKGSTLSS
ncbi:tail assembly chaperone [Microbacterium phage RubyRalph]|nr:tail assembly chaperone [Microbacterium phage RubyRalph]